MKPPWLLLQLTDSAFPSGGFAHSSGLEAACALGGMRDVSAFLDQSLAQAGRASLPFVRAACARPSSLAELDAACDATLPLLAPNRASRAQGRALASAAARIFEGDDVRAIVLEAKAGPAHHAPVFGAIFGALGATEEDAAAAFLHCTLRGILSAGVRLGRLGPLEAQRLHGERFDALDHILSTHASTDVRGAAQTAPLVELYAALHDHLDGRMFQS